MTESISHMAISINRSVRTFISPRRENAPPRPEAHTPVHSLTLVAEVSLRRTVEGLSRNSADPSASLMATALCPSS